MAINLELKAKVNSRRELLHAVKAIARYGGRVVQTDTYFLVKSGRLKLREFQTGAGELICYRRNEGKGRRWSNYTVIPVTKPREVRSFLASAVGVRATVRKKRDLYYYKTARIHLDAVAGLGHFVEFEVVVGKSRKRAQKVFSKLKRMIPIRTSDFISTSYVDLVERQAGLRGKRK